MLKKFASLDREIWCMFQLMYEEERKYKLEDVIAMRSYSKLEELLKLCPEIQHAKNSFAAFFIKRGKTFLPIFIH